MYLTKNVRDLIDICQTLAEEGQLVDDISNHIVQLWSRTLPYEEKSGIKFATITPLVANCILNELFVNVTSVEAEHVLTRNFERFFSAILIRIASTIGNTMPFTTTTNNNKEDAATVTAITTTTGGGNNGESGGEEMRGRFNAEYRKIDPCRIAIDAMKSLLKCTLSYELYEFCDQLKAWTLLAHESTHVEGVTALARGVCTHFSRRVPVIVEQLAGFLHVPYACQRVAVLAFYAELMSHSCTLSVSDALLKLVLNKLVDESGEVRRLCLRALGNMAGLGRDKLQQHSTTLVSAMMAGLDDMDESITLEAMIGLTKTLAMLDERDVRPILINVLLRIRPCFDKEAPRVRTNAYLLFAELARFAANGASRDSYQEQIHANLVNFVLHVHEEDEYVRNACKYLLRQVGPLVDVARVDELLQASLQLDAFKSAAHYAGFLDKLSKLLVS